jgi:hypothetical protein
MASKMASKYDQPQHVSTTHPACQCNISGTKDGWAWCERHQVKKTAHWVRLCQTRPDYFQAWEEGRGPGQVRSKGLGDRVSQALSLVGITEQRVSKLLGRPCGCGKRREALNRLGSRLRKMLP